MKIDCKNVLQASFWKKKELFLPEKQTKKTISSSY